MTKKSPKKTPPKHGSSPPTPKPAAHPPKAAIKPTKPLLKLPHAVGRGAPAADAVRPFIRKGVITAEMRATAKGSPTAEDLLLALKHEGKPRHIADEKYLQRFARYGWHEEEDDAARDVLKLWTKGQKRELKPKDTAKIKLQSNDEEEPTPVIDKAVNTMEALQEVADDYAVLLELRESDPDAAEEFEEQFREKWQGLDPDEAAWFADEGTVTLDEMIAMVLTAEGGSIALDDTLIILLANRARTFITGSKGIADQAGLDWSQFMTAEGLLEAYALGDENNPAFLTARNIINNIFGHDDSFLGAQDRDYERIDPEQNREIRTEGEQIEAWLNLTQNPENVSSGRGGTILRLAVQVADPEQWDQANTVLIDGSSIWTQANNDQIRDDVRGDLNARLGLLGLSEVLYVPTAGGTAAIFLNRVQNRLRAQSTWDPNLLALDLYSQKLWACSDLRRHRPQVLVQARCMTCEELKADVSLQGYISDNGCG